MSICKHRLFILELTENDKETWHTNYSKYDYIHFENSGSYISASTGSEMDSKGNDTHTKASEEKNDRATSLSSRLLQGLADEYLLPPLAAEQADKMTLVLDMDETLIHTSYLPIPDYDFRLKFREISPSGYLYILKRPGVHEFLEAAAKLFEVVVFTAANRTYANAVLKKLDVNGTLISHRLFHGQCSQMKVVKNGREETANVKDLGRLGRDLSKTVIVDDSPVAYTLHPENAVPISSYIEHHPEDREFS